jgi:hypothetical protein
MQGFFPTGNPGMAYASRYRQGTYGDGPLWIAGCLYTALPQSGRRVFSMLKAQKAGGDSTNVSGELK